MATDSTDVFQTATVATGLGLFVAAGLGAVYAYYANTHTQLSGGSGRGKDDGKGKGEDEDGVTVRTKLKTRGEGESVSEAGRTSRKARRRRGKGKGKGKGNDVEVDADDSEREGRGSGETPDAVAVPVVPGGFEGASALPNSTHVDEIAPNPGNDGKTRKKKKAGKAKAKKEQGSNIEDEDEERKAGHGPRSGDSTDASASLFPSRSVSTSTFALANSSPAMGNGDSLRASPARLTGQSVQPHTQVGVQVLPTAQPREIRSSSLSLSLDTDGSWTHVDDHRRVKARQTTAVTDATSSDLASTASDSPVVEHMSGSAVEGVRGMRADVEQPTPAEKPVARPRKTGVESMVEQSDFPTPARVMRVRPRSDDAPVPGFSWDDYGDVIDDEGSLAIHDTDADQEDEGEWGIVKSRSSRPGPVLLKSAFASTSPAAATTTPGSSSAMTKKQRQNARKRELTKSVKAEAEAARLDGLAKHKRELERLRIIEQSQRVGGGKQPSGGMQAAVDERGKLVWE